MRTDISIVAVAVPWSPLDIDGRAYDFRGLAAVADIFFVMAYDTRSQIFDQCIAGPSALNEKYTL